MTSPPSRHTIRKTNKYPDLSLHITSLPLHFPSNSLPSIPTTAHDDSLSTSSTMPASASTLPDPDLNTASLHFTSRPSENSLRLSNPDPSRLHPSPGIALTPIPSHDQATNHHTQFKCPYLEYATLLKLHHQPHTHSLLQDSINYIGYETYRQSNHLYSRFFSALISHPLYRIEHLTHNATLLAPLQCPFSHQAPEPPFNQRHSIISSTTYPFTVTDYGSSIISITFYHSYGHSTSYTMTPYEMFVLFTSITSHRVLSFSNPQNLWQSSHWTTHALTFIRSSINGPAPPHIALESTLILPAPYETKAWTSIHPEEALITARDNMISLFINSPLTTNDSPISFLQLNGKLTLLVHSYTLGEYYIPYELVLDSSFIYDNLQHGRTPLKFLDHPFQVHAQLPPEITDHIRSMNCTPLFPLCEAHTSTSELIPSKSDRLCSTRTSQALPTISLLPHIENGFLTVGSSPSKHSSPDQKHNMCLRNHSVNIYSHTCEPFSPISSAHRFSSEFTFSIPDEFNNFARLISACKFPSLTTVHRQINVLPSFSVHSSLESNSTHSDDLILQDIDPSPLPSDDDNDIPDQNF